MYRLLAPGVLACQVSLSWPGCYSGSPLHCHSESSFGCHSERSEESQARGEILRCAQNDSGDGSVWQRGMFSVKFDRLVLLMTAGMVSVKSDKLVFLMAAGMVSVKSERLVLLFSTMRLRRF